MDHILKAIIIADSHIGADKFDTHPDRWDAPVREAFNYAVEVAADLVISAGDFMHKRNPTVLELLRRRELLDILEAAGIPYVEDDGNHDRSNAEGSHSALEIDGYGQLWQGQIKSNWFGQVKIIGLPWPRPTDYLNDEAMKLPIDEKIQHTRNIILNRITDSMEHDMGGGRKPADPVILVGHCMLAYGPNYTDTGVDPGLILGKDVVLPYQAFLDAGLTENQIFMGHVHDPKSKGYVGSTQPTDWGEAGQDKAFTELVITGNLDLAPELIALGYGYVRNGDYIYATKKHSYADQLRLHDITLDNLEPGVDWPGMLEYQRRPEGADVIRVTVNFIRDADGAAIEYGIREAIRHWPNYGRVDRVILNYPEREAMRVDTGKVKLVDMQEDEAFELWMKQAGYSAEEAIAPYKEFQTLVESSK